MRTKGTVYGLLVGSLLLLTGCSQSPSAPGLDQQTFVEQYPDGQYVDEEDISDLSGRILLSGTVDSGTLDYVDGNPEELLAEPQDGIIEQPRD